jgi:hypothetical protein
LGLSHSSASGEMRYPLACREQKRAALAAAVLTVKAHVTSRSMPTNLGYHGNGCGKSFPGVTIEERHAGLPTVWSTLHCRHHIALPRTASWGQELSRRRCVTGLLHRSKIWLVRLWDRIEALIEIIPVVLGANHFVEGDFRGTLVTPVTLNRVPWRRKGARILYPDVDH